LSRIFETLAWLIIGIRDDISDFISIAVGNSFLIMGTTMQIAAFLIIKKRYTKAIKRFYAVAVVTAICIFNFAVFLSASESTRISLISFMVAMLWIYPIYVLLIDKSSSVLQRAVAAVCFAEVILLILRAYMGIRFGESMSLLSDNISNVMFFLCLYLVMLMGNMGLILMAKEEADLNLMRAATYDELTGIYNRRTFLQYSKENILLSARKSEPLSFLIIDIDNFKRINDSHGHFIGDAVLKSFAVAVKSLLKDCDVFGRFGGEEFTVLIPGIGEEKSVAVAEGIRKAAEDSIVNGGVKYTVSIGIFTMIPCEDTSIDELYKLSDEALYRAKNNGKNRIESASASRIP